MPDRQHLAYLAALWVSPNHQEAPRKTFLLLPLFLAAEESFGETTARMTGRPRLLA